MLTLCATKRTSTTRWYEGVAQFGIARISSRLADSATVRRAIEAALRAEFWNFDMFRRDPIICDVAGKHWLDSIFAAYENIRDSVARRWDPQSPIVIIPHCIKQDTIPKGATPHRFIALDSLTPRLRDSLAIRRPLILALHGGNASYREFASHWAAIADSLDVCVLVPAGTIRFSSVCNSWGDDLGTIDDTLLSVLKRYNAAAGYDPELYIAGFSQGALSAFKFGLMHTDRIHGILSIAGYLDAALPETLLDSARTNGIRIYAISGEFDAASFRASLLQAKRRAEAAHVPFQFDLVPGMIHEVPEDIATRIRVPWAWIRKSEQSHASLGSRG